MVQYKNWIIKINIKSLLNVIPSLNKSNDDLNNKKNDWYGAFQLEGQDRKTRIVDSYFTQREVVNKYKCAI